MKTVIYEKGKNKNKLHIMFDCEPSDNQLEEILEWFEKQGEPFEIVDKEVPKYDMKIHRIGGQFFEKLKSLKITLK